MLINENIQLNFSKKESIVLLEILAIAKTLDLCSEQIDLVNELQRDVKESL